MHGGGGDTLTSCTHPPGPPASLGGTHRWEKVLLSSSHIFPTKGTLQRRKMLCPSGNLGVPQEGRGCSAPESSAPPPWGHHSPPWDPKAHSTPAQAPCGAGRQRRSAPQPKSITHITASGGTPQDSVQRGAGPHEPRFYCGDGQSGKRTGKGISTDRRDFHGASRLSTVYQLPWLSSPHTHQHQGLSDVG